MKHLILLFFSAFLQLTITSPLEDGSAKGIMKQSYPKSSRISAPISTLSTQVAALGRVADLGDLYDVRRDNFIEISLYTTDLSGDAVHTTDNAYSAIDYVRTESLSEKMEKLGVSASLSVSFLGGLVSASGSGKYLNEDKKSAKSAKTSLVYSVRTVREDLKIFSKTSRELIDNFLLENIDATHVVVGVDWGADVVLSLEETNTALSNAQEIQGKLEAALNLAVLSVSGSAEVDFGSSDVEKSSTFSLHLNGDIIPNTVPQTINESIAFIRSIPQLIEKENSGKGKIMNYILMPLVTVQKVFDSENNKSGVVKDIDQELIDQFMRIFQEMKDSELQINDVYNDMSKWALMISESEFTDLSNLKSQFDSFTNDLRVKFADLVVEFRNGELDDEALKDLITTYETSNWTSENVNKLLDAYTPTMHKIRLMNLFESFNAIFLDRRTDKYKILANNYQQEVKIITVDLSTDISSPYVREIVRLLESTSGESEGVNYYVEDVKDLKIPTVDVFLEGNVINSHPVNKKEYVFLIHFNGIVIIIDANSYDQITTYELTQLTVSTIAIVNDTFYKFDTVAGEITSTGVESMMKADTAQNSSYWNHVGSFPGDNGWTRSVAAVNGSVIYFHVAYIDHLYKYDTILKTISDVGQASNAGDTVSLIIVNKILYVYSYNSFYSFDGDTIKAIETPDIRYCPGLFELDGNICRVGGDYSDMSSYPMSCYDPNNKTWTAVTFINEARYYPAVTKTQTGILMFGGQSVPSTCSQWCVGEDLQSVEFFNPDTKIWSYVPSPPAMKSGPGQSTSSYLATTFYF